MPRRKPTREDVLQSVSASDRNSLPAYINTETEEGQARASKESGAFLDKCKSVSYIRDFSNLAPNMSGKPGLMQSDFDYFRPEQRLPVKYEEVIGVSDTVYQRVGLVKNVIDLMGDFTCQGIRVVHPNKKIEQFYKNWFVRVEGKERSERFANYLYRLANVHIRRITSQLSPKDVESIYKSEAADRRGLEKTPDLAKREIPTQYSFLYPGTVKPVGDALGSFVGKPTYTLNLPMKLRALIKNPRTPEEKELVAQLPLDIVAAAQNNKPYPLNPDQHTSFFYKKDDWCSYAMPIIYSILRDIGLYEKLKLADAAALDGAMSKIRIWKLGDHKEKIAPTEAAAAKLGEILESSVGGGTIDIIWNSAIDLLESDTDIHNFLGEAKYNPTLNAIYAGMGIPPTLTGTYGAAGTTNNLMSLKTLIERLKYGRDLLTQFWEYEFVIVQKAMGFRFPAQLDFDYMNLEDEASEKNLWIQLADRRLISDELLQYRFKADPDMEKIRLNREERERDNGLRVEKASPYFTGQLEQELKKIALQTGVATPSEVGLELDQNKRGEKSALELRQPKTPTGTFPPAKKKGQPQKGRPKNSNDKKKRKTKRFTPRMKAMELWAKEAQSTIAEIVNPLILSHFEKPNMRSLTDEENSYAENIKFGVLTNMEPFSHINEDEVEEALSVSFDEKQVKFLENVRANAEIHLRRKLIIDEYRQVQAYCYSIFHNVKSE